MLGTFDELPVLEPVDEGVTLEAVPDAAVLEPVEEVELKETKWPPAMVGGAVLLPVLAAASLYASSVFGDGGALRDTSVM